MASHYYLTNIIIGRNLEVKKVFALFLAVIILFSFCSCSSNGAESVNTTNNVNENTADKKTNQITGDFVEELEAVPDEYIKPLENTPQTVEVTYTHKDHTKSAVVYLPPDYDESNKYNILYILAGVRADHTAFFNEAGSAAVLKNIFDHMITNRDVEPFITVNLAFYPSKDVTFENSNISDLLEDFNEELRDIVIPLMETKFSTYADSTSAEDLVKSRKHRAFSGFSLGGGVCWNTLANDIDYFYYFAPMAAGSLDDYLDNGGVGAVLESKMKELEYDNDDFFIFACEGTDDVTYRKMQKLIKRFRKKYSHIFTFTDTDKSKGNITYKLQQGGNHRYRYAYEYLYNSLRAFW